MVPESGTAPDWQTYANAANGFSIQYPAHLQVIAGSPPNNYLALDSDAPAPAVSIISPRVDTFSENNSHGSYQFIVEVVASDFLPNCNPELSIMSMPLIASGTAMIDGQTARVFTSSDAAAGTHVSTTGYTICYKNHFYLIADIFVMSSDGTPLTPKLEADIAAGKERNKKIVESFTFMP